MTLNEFMTINEYVGSTVVRRGPVLTNVFVDYVTVLNYGGWRFMEDN